MTARNVLVTGGNRGIGKSIAEAMAAAGHHVVVTTRTGAAPEGLQAVTGDVTDTASVDAAFAAAEAIFGGPVEVVVANAGITKDGLLIRMSEQDWEDVMDVNLKSVFLFSKSVARIMMKQRSGSIINIASIIGLIGNAGQSNYSASKGGIIAFTKSVARELASRNVRSNAIAPGFIETRMTEKIPEDLQKKMLDSIPLGRYGKPEDVANLTVFLAGDRSAYITGQVISICGGMVMQ